MLVWFTRFDRLGPCDPLTKRMSPTDYEMMVNVKAYSLVKNTSDVTSIREHDGLSYGASSRKLLLNYSNHCFLILPRNKVSRKIKKRTPEGNVFL